MLPTGIAEETVATTGIMKDMFRHPIQSNDIPRKSHLLDIFPRRKSCCPMRDHDHAELQEANQSLEEADAPLLRSLKRTDLKPKYSPANSSRRRSGCP
ncbi:hypothetical protein E4T56_gene12975 [Termitomyces sp. T112]|nr:hypothetical protein E4T56_gene12975 [Termitomyces sp. T112]